MQVIDQETTTVSDEKDIITNYSPELHNEEVIQENQIISNTFIGSQDLELSFKRDIDDFDLMNGQNNNSINSNDEELLVLSDSQPDPINL